MFTSALFELKVIFISWDGGRVRPEGGFKNRNRKPDLPKHNSGSFYRNCTIFFDIPLPVKSDPEFQIIFAGSVLTRTGNWISPDSCRNLPELNFTNIN